LASRRWGYFAGGDDARHADLHPAEPAALLACARGGWGAARLLEQPIRWQSGWLLGFSDVTALLWARQAAGFAGGIHGPLLTTLAEEPHWSRDRLRNLLFGNAVPDLQGRGGGGGVGSGPLLVANLTVASHLLGSPFVPPLKGAVLVLEDVGEAPYRIDRMLTQWRLNGSLQGLAGLAFGNFEGCADETRDASECFNLEQVLEERTADLGIPRVMDLPVGHRSGNAALPMGAMARLDGQNGQLSLLT
jgi:muramoyltetrapeptide carboxypeptidase